MDFYYYWLGRIKGLGYKRMDKLMAQGIKIKDLFDRPEDFERELEFLPQKVRGELFDQGLKEETQKYWEYMQAKKISYHSFLEEDYPEEFKTLYQPPKGVFVRGKLPGKGDLTLGIVGARDCSPYGRDMARWFAFRLAKAGFWIVSGMAMGVDGWSHWGALDAGGKTLAVLGAGINVCYPDNHRRLYREICRQGTLVSEQDLFVRARPEFFPLRNRLIAAFSKGILLVEARQHSGSLITANQALDQGKDVFVIPGRVGDPLSEGCNQLICAGAIPVIHPDDILHYYGLKSQEEELSLEGKEREIWDKLGSYPLSARSLSEETGMKLTDLLRILLKWKSGGLIRELGQGYFVKD
ncbi:MAG: DNA-processing protein DprA [Eubacterium sp.]|nr:DNA-processing protein DprA [Eubacterium sp.]